MAKRTLINRWFVSVEMPKLRRGAPRMFVSRQTKTFSTEAEARQFAKEMLHNKSKIIAGTLLGDLQPARRFISGSQLYSWIEEEEN